MNTDWSNKKIAILGYGVENKVLLFWLLEHGANDITICDKSTKLKCQISNKIQSSNLKKGIIVRAKQNGVENSKAKLLHRTSFESKNIKFQLGKDYLDNLDKFDRVFRTPGIPFQTPEIQQAIKKGVEISSQMKLFFDLCPAKIIGITGTKGKGTTTALIYKILTKSYKLKAKSSKIYLAGNIGNPPIKFLDQLTKDDWVVLELSSFQLEDLQKSPHIAVVLDITSDHLDYHKDTTEYIDAKINIVRYQSKKDFAVINLDYLTSFKFAAQTQAKVYYFSTRKSVDLGAFIKKGEIILRTFSSVIPDRKRSASGRESRDSICIDSVSCSVDEPVRNDKIADYQICKVSDVKLLGAHNLENICAAATASYLADANIESIRKAVKSYKGLEHRLELVRIYKGVKYYDDSASTNPYTTIAAIRSFSDPIILIAGGSDKGADYWELGKVIAESKNIKKIILLGKTAKKIMSNVKCQMSSRKQFSNLAIEQLSNFNQAVRLAVSSAKKGDIVLLSPASASFDMFENYQERGREFKKIIKKIR